MTSFWLHLHARPRLVFAMLCGLAAALAWPEPASAVTRGLLGWNLTVWLYLGLVGWMMLRFDPSCISRSRLPLHRRLPTWP